MKSSCVSLDGAGTSGSDSIPTTNSSVVKLKRLASVAHRTTVVLSSMGRASPSVAFCRNVGAFSLTNGRIVKLNFSGSAKRTCVGICNSTCVNTGSGDACVQCDRGNNISVGNVFRVRRKSAK